MLKKIATTAALSSALVLAGCATNEPVDLGNGQYTVSASSVWAWSSAGQQADALQEAKEFCAKQGKRLRVTSMQAKDARAWVSVASGQVTFVCEDPEDDEPVALANGIYMLAESSNGHQGIKARFELIKLASKFCEKKGMKVEPLSDTREVSANLTSATGKADTGNTAENALSSTSADLMFRCVKD